LTKIQKQMILERQEMRCAVCRRIITLTANRLRDWKKLLGFYPDKSVPSQAKFHHLIWRSKGGSNKPSNFVALCGFCHTRKVHKPFRDLGLMK